MKIISGKHRNRVIPTLKRADYRPSTAKFREALFSILSSGEFINVKPVENASILDLFAGTGSLAFEALSRGAKDITLIDIKKDYLEMAIAFANSINEREKVEIIVADARYLPHTDKQYNLVFMDPPYHKNYVEKILIGLDNGKWLAESAILAIETSKYEDVKIPTNFLLVKERIYGNNRLLIISYGDKK